LLSLAQIGKYSYIPYLELVNRELATVEQQITLTVEGSLTEVYAAPEEKETENFRIISGLDCREIILDLFANIGGRKFGGKYCLSFSPSCSLLFFCAAHDFAVTLLAGTLYRSLLSTAQSLCTITFPSTFYFFPFFLCRKCQSKGTCQLQQGGHNCKDKVLSRSALHLREEVVNCDTAV